MNPKEFAWSEDQQVTVTNPTGDDFKFLVHSKEYVVGAGQTAKMPGFIAWMYVYKLATKMAIDAGDFIHWNEEGFRKTYYDKIVVGVDNVVQTVEQVPEVETFGDESEDAPEEPLKTVKPMVAKAKNGQSRRA